MENCSPENLMGLLRLSVEGDGWQKAFQQLVTIGRPVVGFLVEVLLAKNHYEEIRWRAGTVLGRIGDKEAIEPLIRVLLDENERLQVREGAAFALGEIGDKKALQSLIHTLEALKPPPMFSPERKLYDSRYESLRNEVTRSLGKIGGADAVEALNRLLEDMETDGYSYTRTIASEALKNIPKPI